VKVVVVGAGYVGLVSAAGFAELGNDVTCVDIDSQRIAALRRGEVPIFEPGLDAMIARNAEAGRLSFTTDVETAVARTQVVFLTVGTPPRADGGADLSSVFAIADTVRSTARREMVLVLKSTVPVGTNARVTRLMGDARFPIHVVSNPEFLKEGDAMNDFVRPDRVVLGIAAGDTFATRIMTRLYKPLNLDRDRLLFVDPPSAELTKYVSNTMLAMRISFMNEVAGLCESVGADIHQVRLGVGSDARIGPKFLYAGPGYGGSCFPKDVQALIATGREHGTELELACATHRVNDRQKGLLLRKVKRHFDGDLRGRRVAIWGVAFKPRTDDIRESPALTLIDTLLSEGAAVTVHDPAAARAVASRFEGRVTICEDAYEATKDADALILVTEWREYQSPDFERLREAMRGNLLVDGRNVWSTYDVRDFGFVYDGVGARSHAALAS
jgi:UDPglucose 6-dehydrogenase